MCPTSMQRPWAFRVHSGTRRIGLRAAETGGVQYQFGDGRGGLNVSPEIKAVNCVKVPDI